MAPTLEALRDRVRDLQDQIEIEMARRREALDFRVERGRVQIEADLRARHRAARVRLFVFLAATRPLVVLTAPLIYSLILPFALLDLMVTIYMRICFPVYGIALVRRRDFIAIDRQHLAYLNGLQKLNCMYCGYCNGVASFVREVAGRTEAFWCPIKHARGLREMHERYAGFMDYADEEDFITRWAESREALKSKR